MNEGESFMIDTTKQTTGHILVVDDDTNMQMFLKKFLSAEGHLVTTCSSAAEALTFIEPNSHIVEASSESDIDLILTDVNMPEMNGHSLLKSVKESRPEIPVIMITAFGTIESAVDAMRRGAHDYVTKPFKLADIRATINRTLNYRKLEKENSILRKEVKRSWTLGDMIGKSQQMQSVFDVIKRVSKVTANVLILGESGTGKEMVARAIHNDGPRAKKPFVAINCAAIPENLLESELFGHAKGSFTGAINQKRGLFEEADGGTIFLDEIADMDFSLQAKLLRVIQERKVRPVGQNTFKSIDVRIIAATHKDLKSSIAEGLFREDLFYRLSVIPILIPPLRERAEDIPMFADYFLKKYAAANGSPVTGFTKAAMSRLICLPWEGNVRQLENTIERAVILCDDALIDESHISFLQVVSPELEKNGVVKTTSAEPDMSGSLTLNEMEKRCLELALKKAGGKKEKAAQILGISRKTLYRKEREYGLCPRTTVEVPPATPSVGSMVNPILNTQGGNLNYQQ